MEKLYFCAIVLLLEIAIFKNVDSSMPCPALPSVPGVTVSCELPNDSKKIPCLGPLSGVPKRTIGRYRCEESSSFSENILECKCRGKWKGMAEFQNYSSVCGSSQSNFSLSGPPELNLTKIEIQNLDGNLNISSGNQTDFAEDALAYHNYYRKLHGASPLVLNAKLSEAAQKWAEHEVSQNTLDSEKQSSNRNYISNMYSLSGLNKFDPQAAAKLAVARWYKSGENYDYSVPVANAFSSMIWNSTTDLGVGIASKGKDVVVVCNYSPPGNVYVVDGKDSDSLALFKQNVYPLVNSSRNSS